MNKIYSTAKKFFVTFFFSLKKFKISVLINSEVTYDQKFEPNTSIALIAFFTRQIRWIWPEQIILC